MNFARTRASVLFLALFTLCLFLIPVALHAQSTTQGSIAGSVVDPSGAVVGGAAITIHNSATNAEFKLTSDGSGFFKAPLLEPGTYSVSVSSSSFAPFRADDVIVMVGQVTNVEPRLAVASSSASVVVAEQVPVLNFESPDFSETLNLKALDSMPINNRRWSSLSMTTPGVVSDSNGYGLVSVRGISPILNNVEIDGADDNQAYYSEERGRTREAYSTSASAVREFAVNSGVYSAEYGRAAGGVITSVTKSGANALHGEAYFYDRESNWNAYNNFAMISTLNSSTGAYVPTHIKPEDLRKIYGFTAGGALIKDKLFWIYTYDQHTHIFPTTGVPVAPSTFYDLPNTSQNFTSLTESCNTTTGYLTGSATIDPNYTANSYACTLAARQGVSYNAGVALYSQWVNALNGDLGTVARAGYQEINTPKLDWQINPKEHWSVLYHRLRWDSPGGVQTAPTDNYARDTQGNDFVKLDYGVTKLTSLITNNVSNELLFQYGRELDDENQQPYTSYTQSYLQSGGNVPQVGLGTSTFGFNFGSPYYSYRKALPDEHKWQIGDTLYYNQGNHSLKFGVDALHNYDLMNNTYESNGKFSYNYLGNYINDQINFTNGKSGSTCNTKGSAAGTSSLSAVGTSACYSSFVQGFGSPTFSVDTMDLGFFVQDNWKVTPRLALELGLRYDYENLPAAVANLTTATGSFNPYPGLANNPRDETSFGPRVGFSYDLFGDGKTVLRGGYGIYYGRINNGNLLNIRLNTGSPNGQFTSTYKPTASGGNPAGPQFPSIETTIGAAATPSSYYLAHNLSNPQVQEFDLQLQRSLGHGTFASASYLGSLGRKLPNFLDLNLNPTTQNVQITVVDTTGKGPLANNQTLTVPTYTGYGNTNLFGSVATSYQSITEMASNINSNYNAMVVEIQNRSLRNIQFDASYTWSHALDFAQNASTTTSTNSWYDPFSNPRINYANSSYNVPNRFVAYALYKFPNLHSAKVVDYVTNDWSFADTFQTQTGLPYNMTIGSSNYNSSDAIATGWNGAGGASFIPGLGLNNLHYPQRYVDDMRLQKEVAFGSEARDYHLQLLANVFNVANHQNYDSINTTAYVLSSTAALAGTATYQSTFGQFTSSNNSGFLYTPREIEISARFIF